MIIEINWRMPDDELRRLRTSLDDDIVEQAENEMLRRNAAAGNAPRLDLMSGGYAQRLCVICDAAIEPTGPNTCAECALKQFPKE